MGYFRTCRGCIALVCIAWTYACGSGEGGTGPAPPPAPLEPPRATTVIVTPATARLTAVGEMVQLSAAVRDQNGREMRGVTATWSSSNPAAAEVNASGLVTATGTGAAEITATAVPASGSAAVTVAQRVNVVEVTPAADTVMTGDTLRLVAAAKDANGHEVADAAFSWASSDPSVATVDETGLVTGTATGSVELSATSSGVTGRAQLEVVAPTPTTLTVTPDSVALGALGDTVRLTAEVRDQIGRPMPGEAVAWAAGDTLVATVDSAGLVTATGNGTTGITASSGALSGAATATVMEVTDSVTVSPSVDTVQVADSLRLTAREFDANGHPVADAEFMWASSDPSVATVDETGLVRGVGEGTA